MESVHYLSKRVAGVPLRRPAWFFDIGQQGEGLSDVGTHLVDLVMWILFPDQAIQADTEIGLLSARRWPTVLSGDDYREITGVAGPDRLEYFCNNQVNYTIRGIHVRLDVLWGLRAEPGGGDTHHAVFQGSRSSIEVRQSQETNHRPELYVVPRQSADAASLAAALQKWSAHQQEGFPGVAVANLGERFWVQVPDRYRSGHEAHFAEVARQFLRYLEDPACLPAWEKPNLLAKYHVTTRGVELAVA
jgi:predicted dehydrogenase